MKMKKVYQIKESEIFKIINNLISEENQSNHTVYASGTIGQSPKYDGLKALFKKFKQAVEAELRSGIPYCVVNGKAKMFTGTKEGGVRILKTNTVGLVGIKDIDPKNPEKQYTLHIGYVVGIKADDYSELGPLEKPAEVPKSDTDTSSATKPLTVTFAGKTSYDVASDSKAKAELNETVKDEYTATNCDELHAFQSTSGKVIGNMNVKVGDKLKELYDKGYNPMVTKVDVTVSGMTVGWKCKIENSKDGKAWVGFTSRGAGCNNDVIKRSESKEFGNDKETARKKIMDTYNEKAIEIEKIDEVVYTAGENSFKQIFYIYTKPGKFPPNK